MLVSTCACGAGFRSLGHLYLETTPDFEGVGFEIHSIVYDSQRIRANLGSFPAHNLAMMLAVGLEECSFQTPEIRIQIGQGKRDPAPTVKTRLRVLRCTENGDEKHRQSAETKEPKTRKCEKTRGVENGGDKYLDVTDINQTNKGVSVTKPWAGWVEQGCSTFKLDIIIVRAFGVPKRFVTVV